MLSTGSPASSQGRLIEWNGYSDQGLHLVLLSATPSIEVGCPAEAQAKLSQHYTHCLSTDGKAVSGARNPAPIPEPDLDGLFRCTVTGHNSP